MRITHGYEVKEINDPFVEMADKATEQFSLATAPGGFLVDLIPARKSSFDLLNFNSLSQLVVRHIPVWFPGGNFQRKAQEWSQTLLEMVDGPYVFVKQQMVSLQRFSSAYRELTQTKASGTALISYSSALLQEKLTADEEFDLKWSAASLYSGMLRPFCVQQKG